MGLREAMFSKSHRTAEDCSKLRRTAVGRGGLRGSLGDGEEEKAQEELQRKRQLQVGPE